MGVDASSNDGSIMDRIYLPLQGPNGVKPKAPAVGAWQSPGYPGVTGLLTPGEWFGMRCDGLVVIDCDDELSAVAWLKRIGAASGWQDMTTWTRKTPHGFHFIYEWTPGSPEGPAVGVFPKTDIRAGRTSQIVMFADGYCDKTPSTCLRSFDPAWLPERAVAQVTHEDECWSEIPDGRGNNTMAAFAGAFRKQGMDLPTMVRCLSAINRITMPTDPMDKGEVIEIARSVSRYAARPDIDIELDDDEA